MTNYSTEDSAGTPAETTTVPQAIAAGDVTAEEVAVAEVVDTTEDGDPDH